MKPQIILAETTSPEGEPLTLVSHDGHFHLQSRGEKLMTTFSHGSEEELATLACAPSRPARQPTVLIGGLGFGFTLASATQALPQKGARFVVAEQTPAIVEWNQTHLRDLHPNLWEDDRILIEPVPVQNLIKDNEETFAAIMLDVDNGPWAFQDEANEALYSLDGLHLAKRALKSGGVLAVWSVRHDKAFEKKLIKAGFEVTCEKVPATKKGKQNRFHTIWLAKKGEYISQNRREH
ncbi:spermidine synthase [Roseibacillus persicicus]|uniref:Spermidine synthase n=1 Tax=Roseibacillus persicicus TaxID=454148 RepID=A0A918WKR5_9BACT|nr:spermidine synthase [Roseibacillus persicicus]GHC55474.1 spermidine synthase [Roseibacillus persicicus]